MILVSNRLPVSIVRRRGGLEFVPSAGGLAVGLDAFYRDHEAKWVGWPGEVDAKDRGRMKQRLKSTYRCYPVFLPEHVARRYYAGFSNHTLWPLFHSFPTYARYDPQEWEAYKRANRLFAEAIAAVADADEVVWIHDYHLMLVPKYLRELRPRARIGFFLHIPFPAYETLCLLPWHRDIVEALLGSDLIGFHTFDYAQAFLGNVRRLLGYDNEIGRVVVGRRVVQVDVFPMGVDFARIAKARETSAVEGHAAAFREMAHGSKLVFSLSRLDYTKGIPQQLAAMDTFLEGNPDWHGRFVYLLVVVPSREIVEHYGEEKREIDRLVGRINSRYGTFDWMPIRYVYRFLDFEELIALFASADVALVTPLRDGMNLVAKEYIASKSGLRGALVLSETAGAARELLEALVVNPNNPMEVAGALRKALEMADEEQERRVLAMRTRLEDYDVQQWANQFLERLEEVVSLSKSLAVRILARSDRKKIEAKFADARTRLILLDYDGTLVHFTEHPAAAAPSPKVRSLLKRLCASSENHIVVISGRRRENLEGWLDGLRLTLVAEHGAWVRPPGTDGWKPTVNLDLRWKDRIRPILERFTQRVPGSAIEEKEASIAWHSRRVDVDVGARAARELLDALTHLTANLEIAVSVGKKVVEVRSSRVSKGTFFLANLADQSWDFILAIGDDWTDESLFTVLPPEAFTVRVGLSASTARYNLERPDDALRLLESLAPHEKPDSEPPHRS